MKVVAIIPARYNSTRFQGKPLADICGKPMIWWVYNQVLKSTKINEVWVATDDERIADVCKQYDMKYVMTSENCPTCTTRIYEASTKIDADLYMHVNGDEPLIDPALLESIIPDENYNKDFYVSNLMTKMSKPSEVVDFTNIKIVVDSNNNCLFMSRSPIPYPKGALDFDYYKHVGVMIYTKSALEFYANTPRGKMERVEDVDYIRFLENDKKLKMVEVDAHTLSVDTPKDLEVVKKLVQEKINSGEISNI